MKKIQFFLLLGIVATLSNACSTDNNTATAPELKPPQDADPKAVEVAKNVIENMGGWQNWKETRYLTWNFFGSRSWIWDKHNGDIRMQSHNDSLTVLMNLDTKEGEVFKDGEKVTNADTLSKYLNVAYKGWVNDSYWLIMPFKFLDSGVNLKYAGEGTTRAGEKSHILQLTFDSVGVTPENKYKVYVSKDQNLVKQWAYFNHKDDEKPVFKTPWLNYQKYGTLKLSGNRGQAKISGIGVYDSLNREVFNKLKPSGQKEKPI